MSLCFRETRCDDVDELFDVRSKTRENPISRTRLAQLGITHASSVEGFESGDLYGWVCVSHEKVVGFCTGQSSSGKVLVLAVLPAFEGLGVGKQLLGKVVAKLLQSGKNPVWLAADSNSAVRAHGFYRRLGWEPIGQVLENGDEILEYRGAS